MACPATSRKDMLNSHFCPVNYQLTGRFSLRALTSASLFPVFILAQAIRPMPDRWPSKRAATPATSAIDVPGVAAEASRSGVVLFAAVDLGICFDLTLHDFFSP